MSDNENSVKIIGFCGKARSGKDSAARAVLGHIMSYSEGVEFEAGYVVGLESYAAPIKSMVAMLLDFFDKGAIMQPETLQPFIEGDRKEEMIPEIGASTRTLMQTLGTEWGRNIINEDIWLNSMIARTSKYTEMVDHGYKGAYILIPDVRFPNEAESLKKIGATIVHLDRKVDEVGEAAHASEQGIPESLIDIRIFNDGTLEELDKATVSALAAELPWAKDYTQIMDDLGTLTAEDKEDDSADEELLTESN